MTSSADTRRYEGDWKENKRTGRGLAILPSGDKYDGEWLNNKPHGKACRALHCEIVLEMHRNVMRATHITGISGHAVFPGRTAV